MKAAVLAAVLLTSLTGPTPAAQSTPGSADPTQSTRLRRCISADGSTIFTDRRCQDLHALESKPGNSTLRQGAVIRVSSCARNQDDLLFGVRSALEAHDVNRFANFYHWTGMGSAAGYRLMERLSAFSDRPLVDVQLTSSREPEGYGLDDYFLLPESIADVPDVIDELPPPRPTHDLLRVDQMRSNKDLSSQVTFFRLRSNAGCWWLQF